MIFVWCILYSITVREDDMKAPKAYSEQEAALTMEQVEYKAKATKVLYDKVTPDFEADGIIEACNENLPGFHQVAYRTMMQGFNEMYRVIA